MAHHANGVGICVGFEALELYFLVVDKTLEETQQRCTIEQSLHVLVGVNIERVEKFEVLVAQTLADGEDAAVHSEWGYLRYNFKYAKMGLHNLHCTVHVLKIFYDYVYCRSFIVFRGVIVKFYSYRIRVQCKITVQREVQK